MEKTINGYTKEEFIGYLIDVMIPDLMESGMDSTALDFETAVAFMKED